MKEHLIFIIPVILGLIMTFYSKNKINYIIGYRTKRSMKNRNNWEWSNKIAGINMSIAGVIGLMVFQFFNQQIAIFILIFILILSVVFIENKLKSNP